MHTNMYSLDRCCGYGAESGVLVGSRALVKAVASERRLCGRAVSWRRRQLVAALRVRVLRRPARVLARSLAALRHRRRRQRRQV